MEGQAVGAEGSRRVCRVMPSPDDAFRSSHTLLSPALVCPHPSHPAFPCPSVSAISSHPALPCPSVSASRCLMPAPATSSSPACCPCGRRRGADAEATFHPSLLHHRERHRGCGRGRRTLIGWLVTSKGWGKPGKPPWWLLRDLSMRETGWAPLVAVEGPVHEGNRVGPDGGGCQSIGSCRE